MTALIEFTCPHCQQTIRTDPRFAGKQGPCPFCAKTITVEAAGGAEFAPPIPDAPKSARRNTDANALIAGLIGGGITFLIYVVILAGLRNTHIGELFANRGPIPFVATFVTAWGISILGLKLLAVRREAKFAGLDLEMIPLQAGMQITPENVGTFIQHLDRLPGPARDSILGQRIRGALEHFEARNSVPEVQSYLSSTAEIDASTVDSGYTLIRAFIWAVPILGFIGTVMGISNAVSELADSLESPAAEASSDGSDAQADSDASSDEAAGAAADEVIAGSQITSAMKKVTGGLAIAFDTTFLALIMAIILLFPTESLKREEYALLDRVESFMNDSLLRRMSSEGSHPLSAELAKIMEPAFKEHQRWLTEWQTQVGDLGTVIGRSFEMHATRIQEQLERIQLDSGNATVTVVEACNNATHQLTQSLGELRNVGQDWTSRVEAAVAAGGQLQKDLESHHAYLNQMVDHWNQAAHPSVTNGHPNVVDALHRLNQGLHELNLKLDSAPPLPTAGNNEARRGLFGRGRR